MTRACRPAVCTRAWLSVRSTNVAAQNAQGFVGLGAPVIGQLAQNTTQSVNVPLQQGAEMGGVQTLAGPWVGAVTFTWLADVAARATEYWRALLGGVILLLVLAFPMGIAGFVHERWLAWRARTGVAAA